MHPAGAEGKPEDVPAPPPEYSEDGVDLSLIRWFLSLTPAERLKFHQGWINGIQRIRALNDID